jgi:hypothetical protein
MKPAPAMALIFLAVSLPAYACNLIADSEPHLRDGVADIADMAAEDAAEFPAETEGETLPDPVDTAADDPQDLPDLAEEDSVDPCTLYTRWYRDADNDGYGNEDDFLCQILQPDFFVIRAGDCCDLNGDVSPDQRDFFEVPYSCPDGEYWDYDCDGLIELEIENPAVFRYCHELVSVTECDAYLHWTDATDPGCGVTSELNECAWDLSDDTCDFYQQYYHTQRCR